MKFIIIHKEPIVERVPNLKAFILYVISHQHEVILITTRSKIFPEPSFLTERIKYFAVLERSGKFEMPTSIRFYSLCILVLIKNLFKKYSLILAGRSALALGAGLGFFRLNSFSSFIIEYPAFLEPGGSQHITMFDRLEYAGIRFSDLLITHDSLHAEFIAKKLNMGDVSYTTVPNGTPGRARREQTKFLHDKLNIESENKIILHSGGFGPWFSSAELAASSVAFPCGYIMVFHFSHDISENSYYLNYLKTKAAGDRSVFSMSPVSSDQLDELVSSARIGIAWYSSSVLGYRATKMGLAAGKIGNYLKCGIPVIVPNFDSLNYVSDYSCGIQVECLDDVAAAICKIEEDYKSYSDKAIDCYQKLWSTEVYCEALVAKLEY